MGPCYKTELQRRPRARRPEKWFGTECDSVHPAVRIQPGPMHAAKGGVPLPPTIMAIASALSSLLTAETPAGCLTAGWTPARRWVYVRRAHTLPSS